MPRVYEPKYEFPPEDRELVKNWIATYHSQGTKDAYYHGLANFVKWWKKPLQTFLDLQKHQWMQTTLTFQSSACENMKANTVLTSVRALSSFCYYHKGETFNLRRQRLHMEMDVSSHIFRNGDIAAMFDVAGPEQKAFLSVFSSLGWEASAVLGLPREQIESLIAKTRQNSETFVYLEGQRAKTGVPRYAALSPLAVEYLLKWFEQWKGKTVFKITTKAGLNENLKTLAKKSGIITSGSIHSHGFRKWVMDQLSRAGWNTYQIHLYVGKRIPSEDQTYLQTLREQIRELYPATYEKYLNLKPQKIVVDEELKRRVGELEKENEGLKTRQNAVNGSVDALEALLRRVEDLEKKLKGAAQ